MNNDKAKTISVDFQQIATYYSHQRDSIEIDLNGRYLDCFIAVRDIENYFYVEKTDEENAQLESFLSNLKVVRHKTSQSFCCEMDEFIFLFDDNSFEIHTIEHHEYGRDCEHHTELNLKKIGYEDFVERMFCNIQLVA